MKLGLYGGGFKPFTTGHFAKLADAIRENDKVYLFYGMQQVEPIRYGKRGQALKARQKFRTIGNTEKTYNEDIAQSIFEIYKTALERIPKVEVVLIQSQAKNEQGELAAIRAPVTAIFKTLEDFVNDPGEIEKITIYGDAESMSPYMRSPKLRDHVQTGKIQFGGAVPSSPDDYTEKLDQLMAQGEEEAREALRDFYLSKGEEIDDEEVMARQTVRGTHVRNLASLPDTSQEAKKYLPPFLNDAEKDQIIQILSGGESLSRQIAESDLRYLVRGFIRG